MTPSARQKRQCVHCAAGLPMSVYEGYHQITQEGARVACTALPAEEEIERLEKALRQVRHSHNAHVVDTALADAAPAEQEAPNA